MQLDKFPDSSSSGDSKTAPAGPRRLIVAIALGIAAVAGLTLTERMRERVPVPTPPHEPSQALITTVAPVPEQSTAGSPMPPPAPPEIKNDEKLVPPQVGAAESAVIDGKAPGKPIAALDAHYMVQLGVFNTAANAQSLQKQLKRAGITAHLETFVKMGPFKDRHEAEKALARAKKLGVQAVLVIPPLNQ
ncbi:MAG: SPOR domain-containing protein [Betaproteobacteria bacterium]